MVVIDHIPLPASNRHFDMNFFSKPFIWWRLIIFLCTKTYTREQFTLHKSCTDSNSSYPQLSYPMQRQPRWTYSNIDSLRQNKSDIHKEYAHHTKLAKVWFPGRSVVQYSTYKILVLCVAMVCIAKWSSSQNYTMTQCVAALHRRNEVCVFSVFPIFTVTELVPYRWYGIIP